MMYPAAWSTDMVSLIKKVRAAAAADGLGAGMYCIWAPAESSRVLPSCFVAFAVNCGESLQIVSRPSVNDLQMGLPYDKYPAFNVVATLM